MKKRRRKDISPAPAVRATYKSGRSVGLMTGALDRHDELEIKVDVDGHSGSVWISREFWQAIGLKVGWIAEETRLALTEKAPGARR